MMNSPLAPSSAAQEAQRVQQEAEVIRQRQKQGLMGWSGMAYMPPQWADKLMNSDFPAMYEQAQQGFPMGPQQTPSFNTMMRQAQAARKPLTAIDRGKPGDSYAEVMGAAVGAGYRAS